MDALTVVVGKASTWVDYLTVAELKKMWEPSAQGKVTNWNQIRDGFPDAPMALTGPGADSGTFDYFTEAVVGKAKSSRGDYQASEDDNVIVQFVSRNKGALGYFGLAYYEENKDKLIAVPIKATDTVARDTAVGRNGQRRHLPAAGTTALHLRQRQVDEAPRGQTVRRLLSRTGRPSWRRRSATSICRKPSTPRRNRTSLQASSAPASAARRKSASRSPTCWSAKARCSLLLHVPDRPDGPIGIYERRRKLRR